jgi:hypothetical protein
MSHRDWRKTFAEGSRAQHTLPMYSAKHELPEERFLALSV